MFIDKKSGKNTDREALKDMLGYVREGDTVVTESISRIDEKQFKVVCRRWRNGEITATSAMKELKLKPNTFYRRVKKMNL